MYGGWFWQLFFLCLLFLFYIPLSFQFPSVPFFSYHFFYNLLQTILLFLCLPFNAYFIYIIILLPFFHPQGDWWKEHHDKGTREEESGWSKAFKKPSVYAGKPQVYIKKQKDRYAHYTEVHPIRLYIAS